MSSSYLGHGAKYWADRYFEQHTQTRLPDDPADLSWREKYLALEKECEHYQATLSEMRVEIEYLRSQQPTSIVADPDLQRKAEKWKLGYTRLAAALKEKEKQYDALSAEKQRLECHLQERELYRGKTAEQWAELYFSEQRNYQKATSDLQESDSEIQTLNSTIANYHKFNEVDGHDATYWHHRYTTSQKEAFKANVFSALVIFFIAFSFGAVFGNHVGGSENLSPSFQTASSSISLSPQVQPQTSIVYSSSNESNTIPLTVTASKNNSYYFCLCQGSKSLKVIMCVPVKRLQQLVLREATLFILRMGPAHLLGSVHKICGELILLFIISLVRFFSSCSLKPSIFIFSDDSILSS